jgi:hypothetical protein
VSSRVTYTQLGHIHQVVKDCWRDANPREGSSVATWFCGTAIRLAESELEGEAESRNPVEEAIAELLRLAVRSDPRGPEWFPYVEACLHMSERLLGLELRGRVGRERDLAITRARQRSRVCGAYATPGRMTETLLEDAFATLAPDSGTVSMLDLSVEAGQSAVAALAFAPAALALRIFGVDRDPDALRLTRKLWRFGQRHAGRRDSRLSLVCRDSLLDPLPSGWPRQFDIIAGNPPWAAGPGAYTECVRRHFHPWLRGRFDLYLAFMLRADSLLKAGGCLALILPSSFLFNDACRSVREHLLEHYDIVRLRVYPLGSFVELRIVPVLLVLRRKQSPAQRSGLTQITWPDAESRSRKRLSTELCCQAAKYWKTLPGRPFHPWVRPGAAPLVRHLNAFPRLVDFGAVLQGIGVRKSGAQTPFAKRFTGYQAGDVLPFHACTGNLRVYSGMLPMREPPQEQDIRAPKVLLQRFRFLIDSRRLVAAAAGPNTYAVNSASLFVPEDGALVDFFTAVLNSSVANAWFKLRDISRTIKMNIVRAIPVAMDRSAGPDIVMLARKCAWVRQELHTDGKVCSSDAIILARANGNPVLEEARRIERRLDDALFELYRLSRTERQRVRELSEGRVF